MFQKILQDSSGGNTAIIANYVWSGTVKWENRTETYTFNASDKGILIGIIGANPGNYSIIINGKTIINKTSSPEVWNVVYIPIKRGDVIKFNGTNYANYQMHIGSI